jgi:hypothetical protein
MKYLLDANVFVQAKNLHYGLDFCPAFWEWLVLMNDQGLVLKQEMMHLPNGRGVRARDSFFVRMQLSRPALVG